jgi:glycosyltransferase involved in cell wall biosynthesis
VGGEWTADQRERAGRLGVAGDVTQVRGLTREQVASLYRRAAVVLQPSEAEGFGLPVVEALACGARVVASDIPVLREVGGPAAAYRPVGDVGAWAAAVGELLDDPAGGPGRSVRLEWASRYSWAEHARIVLNSYLAIIGHEPVG